MPRRTPRNLSTTGRRWAPASSCITEEAMRWSKVKQLVEERFAPSLHGRVEVHSTRYYSGQGRGWITIDKREVADMSHARAIVESVRIARETTTFVPTVAAKDAPRGTQWYSSRSYDQV